MQSPPPPLTPLVHTGRIERAQGRVACSLHRMRSSAPSRSCPWVAYHSRSLLIPVPTLLLLHTDPAGVLRVRLHGGNRPLEKGLPGGGKGCGPTAGVPQWDRGPPRKFQDNFRGCGPPSLTPVPHPSPAIPAPFVPVFFTGVLPSFVVEISLKISAPLMG